VRVYQLVGRVASASTTVLITGESGSGKELVARAVHHRSPRGDQPFVAVNAAAIPETRIESELFGYEKGAFTGALARKLVGLELAHGGTIFLNETPCYGSWVRRYR
jgi:transcriptional regulator with PAS, ATPase and Fis domain